MSTQRYVLYVSDMSQRSVLVPWIRSQTHVQLLSTLPIVPPWLDTLPTPVLVDMLKLEAVWGTEIQVLMQSRKPQAKFGPVETLE